jgi:glutamate synthase (NADPH/NADH) large chain
MTSACGSFWPSTSSYTGSSRAQMILDDWATYRPKFVKVMPVEYRRALREMEEQRLGMVAAQ